MKNTVILLFVCLVVIAGCDQQGPPMKDPTNAPKSANALPVGQGSVLVQIHK